MNEKFKGTESRLVCQDARERESGGAAKWLGLAAQVGQGRETSHHTPPGGTESWALLPHGRRRNQPRETPGTSVQTPRMCGGKPAPDTEYPLVFAWIGFRY